MKAALICLAVALLVTAALCHEQKTTFEVKERREQGGSDRQRTQTATVQHDVVGGKNWGAGGYVTHQRQDFNGLRSKSTHGGLQFNARF